MTTLEQTIAFATEAHEGQVDKQGVPYILHPLAVMLAVSEPARKVAVLHDVVEDTDYSLGAVAYYCHLSSVEVLALDLLTRPAAGTPNRPSYREHIERIAIAPADKGGVIAREVKPADIDHNLGRLTPELAGMEKRYRWALERLDLAEAKAAT